MADVENKEDLVEDGKNKMVIRCKFCDSIILDKKSATYVTQEMALPFIKILKGENNRKVAKIQNEAVNEFYHVENMYMFENIGFPHTVDNHKYLSCADCDAGPVGYYNMNTEQGYVAVSRIVHS